MTQLIYCNNLLYAIRIIMKTSLHNFRYVRILAQHRINFIVVNMLHFLLIHTGVYNIYISRELPPSFTRSRTLLSAAFFPRVLSSEITSNLTMMNGIKIHSFQQWFCHLKCINSCAIIVQIPYRYVIYMCYIIAQNRPLI